MVPPAVDAALRNKVAGMGDLQPPLNSIRD
jgi:hypothetical protein